MKINLFIGSLTGGGAERVLCNLANYLNKCGHEVCIITNVEGADSYALDENIKRYILLHNHERKNRFFNFRLCMKRLKSYVKENSNDNYLVFLPLTSVMLLSLRKYITGSVTVSERGDPKRNTRLMKFLLSRWISRADNVVFQTGEAAEWYKPYLKGTPYRIVPNAINPAFILPVYTGERENRIAAAGRLTEQKNFALLIRAFSKIHPDFPEYKLTIYGKGGLLDSLKALANELSVGDMVEFPGYIDNMPEVLGKATMFVLSSDYEGMPNALMEAMALGLPCVSTDCGGGGARFLIQDGVNGFLVPAKDEDALADAIKKILCDQNLAKKFSENACKLQETLAPEKIYGEWERIINS